MSERILASEAVPGSTYLSKAGRTLVVYECHTTEWRSPRPAPDAVPYKSPAVEGSRDPMTMLTTYGWLSADYPLLLVTPEETPMPTTPSLPTHDVPLTELELRIVLETLTRSPSSGFGHAEALELLVLKLRRLTEYVPSTYDPYRPAGDLQLSDRS